MLISGGRRSRRRRGFAAVGAVGAAVVAVVAVAGLGVPVVVDRTPVDREPTADLAAKTNVVHRSGAVQGAADCTATPLRREEGDDPGMFPGIFDGDASGERRVRRT